MSEILVTALICVTSALMWALNEKRIEKKAFRDEIEHWRITVAVRDARLHDVEPREARFRQALGYYADEETWVAPGRAHSPAFSDRGRIARNALGGQ